MAKQEESALDYGLWKGTLSGNKVCFALENAGAATRETRRICFRREEIRGFAERDNQAFKIKQEQGTLLLEGDFSNGKGQGIFKFEPNPSFVKFLKNEDRIEIAEQNVLLLFFHKIDKSYIKEVIRETIKKNILRHSLVLMRTNMFLRVVNKDGQKGDKEDRRFKDYHSNEKVTNNTNHTHQSSRHTDGAVSVETINGTTYLKGAGTHNINGQVINVEGEETWVITPEGETYILDDDAKRAEKVLPKKKTNFNKTNKVRPSSGLEKHYLNASKKKGHLDWIGYNTTILEPSTQDLYQLPTFCRDLKSALVEDEIIDSGDKILFYFGEKGAYVNGWHLSGGQETKYIALAKKV